MALPTRDAHAIRIEWVLRTTVCLQCLGNARLYLQVRSTPLFLWLWSPDDAGGLGLSESFAWRAESMIGMCLLLAAPFVLLRPRALVLLPLALLESASAIAVARLGLGFVPDFLGLAASWAWPLALGAHLARIAAPVALMLVHSHLGASARRAGGNCAACVVMRWSIAVVFVCHGVEAIHHYPPFLDLIIGAQRTLVGWSSPEWAARYLLTVIGCVDVVVGVLCLSRRWPVVAFYLALWGLVTALSRPLATGFPEFHETLVRSAHVGLPLALALYWMQTAQREEEEPQRSPNDEWPQRK